MLSAEVYAPEEQPRAGRLYAILKGSARHKGMLRSKGYSWGALDVMLPNAPAYLMRRAYAVTYLHVMCVDGPTLREIAEAFPKTQEALRRWTFFNGVKEFLLEKLRNATDEERRAANEAWARKARGEGGDTEDEEEEYEEPPPKANEIVTYYILNKTLDARFKSFMSMEQRLSSQLKSLQTTLEAVQVGAPVPPPAPAAAPGGQRASCADLGALHACCGAPAAAAPLQQAAATPAPPKRVDSGTGTAAKSQPAGGSAPKQKKRPKQTLGSPQQKRAEAATRAQHASPPKPDGPTQTESDASSHSMGSMEC